MLADLENEKNIFQWNCWIRTSIDASMSYFSRSLLIIIHMEGLLCIMRRRLTVLPSV